MKIIENKKDMTQEEKDLVFKDLCARLPYGLKVHWEGCDYGDKTKNLVTIDEFGTINDEFQVEDCKPYLRPMASITEGERRTYKELSSNFGFTEFHKASAILVGWLNQKMFDYRGLIPNGLALEAPKDMYDE